MQKVHFIAIGGSAMHNLAIALHRKGFDVTGSDDEIYEPSSTRLYRCGLLPEVMGWHAERITADLDAVILGMHARADNPELLRAQELGLAVYSYPEFIHRETAKKTRVVIGGSHGKTTITSMIIHVLRHAGVDVDYLVGAQLEGFDCMVRLSDKSEVAVLEGDEYLSSAIDRRPKFHLYRPDIALISGIAWDHINVFPTLENYVEQFRAFIRCMEPGGKLIYAAEDPVVAQIVQEVEGDHQKIPYRTPAHSIMDGVTYLGTGQELPLLIFGRHNLQNLEGARNVCHQLGIGDKTFNAAIASFAGASKRLEKVAEREGRVVFKDFAHSPSKLKATLEAVREQYPDRQLVACMELHTFSSLRGNFLDQYAGTMGPADRALVFYDEHAVKQKRAELIGHDQIRSAFERTDLDVIGDQIALMGAVRNVPKDARAVLLIMSSGALGGVDLEAVAESFIA